jgi:hypothetical protein
MRHLRPLLLSTFLGAGVLAVQVAPNFAQAADCPPVQGDLGAPPTTGGADVAVYADEAPPPLPDYDQPPIPAEGDLWTPGYWSWNGYEYFWVPGTWVEPPQPGFLWTPGYWAFVGGVYAFHRGYWGEHVGFYGGVSYGFGYGGAGYEGGHWDNGRFFYNRSVTNIGQVDITNVYNQPVTINQTANRASFNGGPGGVDAKPTPVELEAAKDKHIAPTTDQLHNARIAGRTDSAFVSANKGKPSIAATAKPGEFKGRAVVPAKAAGGPLQPAGAAPGAAGSKGAMTPEPTKTPPESTKTPLEKKLDQPKPEGTKSTPEMKLDQPKPEATKPTPEMKLERPKPEPTKPTPEMKIERPKPEPMKSEPQIKLEPNKPAPRNFAPAGNNPPKAEPGPQARPQGPKPERACGRPGEPPCPK